MKTRIPIETRFWAKVNKTDGCWLWTAHTVGFGYGCMGRGGAGAGNVLAHRLSWEMHKGPIPPGMCVLHRCDVPGCVRPDHLFLGTRTDNAADRDKKGRTAAGGKMPQSILTEAQVAEVVKLIGTMKQKEVGKLFGVCNKYISGIAKGQRMVRANRSEMTHRKLYPKGSQHHQSKLTEAQVAEIKSAIREGQPLASIAVRYGVTPPLIGCIKRGTIWKHVA